MLPHFFAGGHLMVVGMVALLVIAPKDLPRMLRQLGKAVGAMRRMINEVRTSLEDMARQSELDELRAEVETLRLSQAETQAEAPKAPAEAAS